MYLDDFSIKEVNTYYARRGGIRTANVKGYANVGSFSGLMQRAAAQAGRAAQAAAERDSQTAGARSTVPRNTDARIRSALYDAADARQAINSSSARQTGSAAGPGSASGESAAQDVSASSNTCCDQCDATNQLMLQMLSRNLYSQSALNYPLTGYGSWTAYQNMANMLGKGLF